MLDLQMLILSVNCGSSTLKFRLVQTDGERLRTHASGLVDRVGPRARARFTAAGGHELDEARPVDGHGEAMRAVLEWLRETGLLAGLDAVGHRVVHGGAELMRSTVVDDDVLDTIERAAALAPLHNAPALDAIRAARETLGGEVPMVAAFDTAFHATLPERAWRYAIPLELADGHSLRRFGFHGLAHRWMAERSAQCAGVQPDRWRCVTLQLGNGCSAAAIDAGRSVDTSMGLTPLEGLVMGTRSGDVDPSLVLRLAELEGLGLDGVDELLNQRSGLLGLSGVSQDMRDLLGSSDPRVELAVDVFCYRVRKYIGAYLAALGGADAVVFGGGIGEHAPEVRARILEPMAWFGVELDEERNREATGTEARISTDGSRVAVWVVPVDEDAVIVRDVVTCLSGAAM